MYAAWDCFRALIVALGFVLGAMNVSVIVLHFRAWRAVKDRDRTAGLLPLHVFTIAASYGILAYTVTAGVVSTYGDPPSIRLFLYLLAFVLGIVALAIVATRQRRRIKFRPPVTTVTIEEDTKTTQED
jgi:hypothetical protein